jgi:hypothetical protein
MVLIPRERRKAFEGTRIDLVAQVHGLAPGKVNALALSDVQVGITEGVGGHARTSGVEIEGEAIL